MSTPAASPPGRQLGRRPADPARLEHTVRLQLTGVTPAHPVTADHLTQVPRWMLGANNRFGTCGPTSVANHAVMTWKYLLGQDITVTDEAVFALYRLSGNPNFNPATGADDNGVDMTVMLSALVTAGIEITHADGGTETVKPLCFAQHGTAIEDVHAVTSIFGGDLFGLDLDVAQQAQTDAGLWDFVPQSGVWGGHATMGGAYTSASGAGQRDETNITWQQAVGMTDTFLGRQLMEAYAVVWEPLWDNPAFQAGVDRAALAADYTAETGRPFPVPAGPGPAPAPGGGVQADAADRALAAAIPWPQLTGRHTGVAGHWARPLQDWYKAKGLAPQAAGG